MDGGGRDSVRGSVMRSLSERRAAIDRVDREIVALLNRRAEIVLGLAPLKKELGINVYEPDREGIVMDNIAAANVGPLSNEALERVYQALISEMRDLQRERFD